MISEEQVKAFLEKVKGNTGLQEKLKAAADANAVVEIAKEAGFSLSAEDFNKAELEISDLELEGVVGGNLSLDSHCIHKIWNGLCEAQVNQAKNRSGTNVNQIASHVC
jgi:predicted ribosomally synthesized peptide with nif11-like leader